MRERPSTVVHIASTVVRKLSPLVRQCDYALDWIFLESGRAVYRQDESSDSTYIVLSGRLRSVVTQTNGKKEIVGEYGKGDMVGIIEMLTGKQAIILQALAFFRDDTQKVQCFWCVIRRAPIHLETL